mmetsp:Transcript_102552/g.177923  ORF Transcript_102552/g.177923 Transcript_102552/m.177923 type:complete len:259 (+) Transcript_102552:512-1288(+)
MLHLWCINHAIGSISEGRLPDSIHITGIAPTFQVNKCLEALLQSCERSRLHNERFGSGQLGKEVDAIGGIPIREFEVMREAALEPRVGVEHLRDVSLVSRNHYHHASILGTGHCCHNGGAGLCSIRPTAQFVCFINEQHPALGSIQFLLHLHFSLSHILPCQIQTSSFFHVVPTNKSQIIQYLRHDSGNCSFACPRLASKNKMAQRRQLSTFPLRHFKRVAELLKLLLDPFHAVKLVKAGKGVFVPHALGADVNVTCL